MPTTLQAPVIDRKPHGDGRGHIVTVRCPVCELRHVYYVVEQQDEHYKTAACDVGKGGAILRFKFDHRTVPERAQ